MERIRERVKVTQEAGTRWDWDTIGLEHIRTQIVPLRSTPVESQPHGNGTQGDKYTIGLEHIGTRVVSLCPTLVESQPHGNGTQGDKYTIGLGQVETEVVPLGHIGTAAFFSLLIRSLFV